VGSIDVVGQSVVTSGIYERYFEQDGKRWHHILDPRSGYPLDNELESVTIISDDSLDGDIWTTLIFGLGVEKAARRCVSARISRRFSSPKIATLSSHRSAAFVFAAGRRLPAY
jgi:thiamine biosynthesis lipoprotein ApbE